MLSIGEILNKNLEMQTFVSFFDRVEKYQPRIELNGEIVLKQIHSTIIQETLILHEIL